MNLFCMIAGAAGGLAAVKFLVFSGFLLSLLIKCWKRLEEWCYVYQVYKVPEFDENRQKNQLYDKVWIYLSSLPSLEDSDFTNLVSGKKSSDIRLKLDPEQIVNDCFVGANVAWQHEVSNSENKSRSFLLRLRKQDKRRILRSYLQYIQISADEAEVKRKDIRLYTNVESGSDRWKSVSFTHPTTLETILLDAELKNRIRSDLESFVKAKRSYHRIGRIWKRSYLLHGPGRAGKTSFIAAMAKFLNYNVFNLDLSLVKNESDLKSLILQTTVESVVLMEDLDRFLKQGRVSASWFANLMDGVMSCCGEERVMVFTVNSKESVEDKVRFDVQIYFPLCDFLVFKEFASSYLGVKDHKLFAEVEVAFESSAGVSSEEIGEILLLNRNSPSKALKAVIMALKAAGGNSAAAASRRSWRLEEACDSEALKEKTPSMRELRTLYGFLRRKTSGTKGDPFQTGKAG